MSTLNTSDNNNLESELKSMYLTPFRKAVIYITLTVLFAFAGGSAGYRISHGRQNQDSESPTGLVRLAETGSKSVQDTCATLSGVVLGGALGAYSARRITK